MARKLNTKQKKLIDGWMKADPKFNGFNITNEQEEQLNKINLFEDLLGCVDRYISDKRLEDKYNPKYYYRKGI